MDEKPIGVRLGDARSRSRATTVVPQMGYPGLPNAPPYGYFPPFFPLPWPYPMCNVGQFCPSAQPSQPHSHGLTIQSSAPLASITDNPDIVSWFASLDHNEKRDTGGVSFAPFGHILREKGFLRLSQLTPKFVQLQDLQAWLGIEVGTAILIMQYAEEDLSAARSEVHAS